MNLGNRSEKNKITNYKVNNKNKDDEELIRNFDNKRKLKNALIEHTSNQNDLYIIEEPFELDIEKVKEKELTEEKELTDNKEVTEEKVIEAIEEVEKPIKIKRKNLEIIKIIIIGILAIIIGLFAVYKLNNSFKEDANNIYVKKDLVGVSQKFDYYPAIVISGSMEPAMMTYSISICQSCSLDDLQVGDIAVFVHNNEIITHRVMYFTENLVGDTVAKTKGDNNPYEDTWEVSSDMVQGKVVYTFNGTADIIKNYMGTDGQLDTLAITRTLIYLIAFTGIAISIMMWLSKTLIALYSTIRKNGYKDKIEELTESLNKALECCKELGLEIELHSNEIENKKENEEEINKETEDTFYLYEQDNKKSSKIKKVGLFTVIKRISLVKELNSQIKCLKDLEEHSYVIRMRKRNNKNNKDKSK